jgi:hypothetical protein
LLSSKKSFPTFVKFDARRVFGQDTVRKQTIKIGVHLDFKGRISLRYEHILAYDPEEHGQMMFDNEEEK